MEQKPKKQPPTPAPTQKGKKGKVKKNKKGVIDRLMGRLIARKLAVWVAATVALGYGMLTSSDWVAVSLTYIGSQAAVDLAAKWKSK